MIEISNLCKSYGATPVLHDVSLSLPRGGITSLIGPNGAGKSTLLSLIARLIAPDSGSVTVDGLDVTRAPGPVLARRLAILRQENHLVARLTVRELVGFGRFPHSAGRLTPQDRAAIDRALDYLELAPLADRFIDQLSGGQRQRAFVAMVLAQDTDYLLLDEPLNNLDMKHAQAMMRLLASAARELGKTVIVVLHDINFASCHSDRIVAMRQGRIFAAGTPAQIVTPDLLGELYEMQIAVREIDGQRIALFYE
ncbi:ABC transporter ATP-binding protein [Paracoccus ferrooxidans]|nr:ABC transporter ATP-binding protein [Paracoccus ferrooxidans]